MQPPRKPGGSSLFGLVDAVERDQAKASLIRSNLEKAGVGSKDDDNSGKNEEFDSFVDSSDATRSQQDMFQQVWDAQDMDDNGFGVLKALKGNDFLRGKDLQSSQPEQEQQQQRQQQQQHAHRPTAFQQAQANDGAGVFAALSSEKDNNVDETSHTNKSHNDNMPTSNDNQSQNKKNVIELTPPVVQGSDSVGSHFAQQTAHDGWMIVEMLRQQNLSFQNETTKQHKDKSMNRDEYNKYLEDVYAAERDFVAAHSNWEAQRKSGGSDDQNAQEMKRAENQLETAVKRLQQLQIHFQSHIV